MDELMKALANTPAKRVSAEEAVFVAMMHAAFDDEEFALLCNLTDYGMLPE